LRFDIFAQFLLAWEREEIIRPMAEEKIKSGKGDDGSGGRGNKRNPRAKLPKGLATRATSAKAAGMENRPPTASARRRSPFDPTQTTLTGPTLK
jgi:hypothetical protein